MSTTYAASIDLPFASATQLLSAFKAGALSPVEATQHALARVHALDGHINAFRVVSDERARAAARMAEHRYRQGNPGALEGLPFSAKDTLMVAGIACRRGSMAMPDEPAEESAPVVDHAETQGGVLLGVTTTPEFGAGAVTISPLTGVTRNPWNLAMNAGGSSGGAGAAVASGLGCVALATDAGGSARIPAALCGIVGFKPTGGRLPTYPPNVAGTLSAPGLMARNVRDIALLMNVCAQPDVRDAEMLPPDATDYLGTVDALAQGKRARDIRIAFSTDLGFARRIDAEVSEAVRAAATHFAQLGYQVEEAPAVIDDPTGFFVTLFQAGFAYTSRGFTAGQMERIGPALRTAIQAGGQVGLFDYMAAQDLRRALARRMNEFHRRYDFLILPTTATTAFDAERWVPAEFEDLPNTRAWTPFTALFNLSQQPAISVPCGLSRRGLPIGLQIAGPRFADARVLQLAHHFFSTHPAAAQRPALDWAPAEGHHRG
ncbi:amidase family protein [Pseudorhodoferax sp.]|uniref:amidase family protein n=1 Tax=Pseudorhodoferax sp. TaxID=1993553 RepID=UPI002DD64FAA|nr:amidase family protein [Pseudorhodoferax sp.]